MIMVDCSVWIDYFNGRDTPETLQLDSLLGIQPIAIGDIILTEVLQGFRNDRDYQIAKSLLTSLTIFELLGDKMALKSAENYRQASKESQLEKLPMSSLPVSALRIIYQFCFWTNIFSLLPPT